MRTWISLVGVRKHFGKPTKPHASAVAQRPVRLSTSRLRVPLPRAQSLARIHRRLAFFRAVVEGSEPAAERDVAVSAITSELFVMETVSVAVVSKPVCAPTRTVSKPTYPCSGSAPRETAGTSVARVRGHDELDKRLREIQEMLDRMHGEARPGSRVHVLVVQLVDGPVDWRPMEQAVNNGHALGLKRKCKTLAGFIDAHEPAWLVHRMIAAALKADATRRGPRRSRSPHGKR